jgi:hypothetical protein
MKKLFLLFFCLFLAKISFAQTPQTEFKRTTFEPPKTVNGFKVRWATLSKGKYQEVFTNDTIQQIGSVYFNRITGEVVGEVVKDSLYFPADVSSRWWSVDPLAAKFPEQSPYVFVDNNPIYLIDPDGREAMPIPSYHEMHPVSKVVISYSANIWRAFLGKKRYKLRQALGNLNNSKNSKGQTNAFLNLQEGLHRDAEKSLHAIKDRIKEL